MSIQEFLESFSRLRKVDDPRLVAGSPCIEAKGRHCEVVKEKPQLCWRPKEIESVIAIDIYQRELCSRYKKLKREKSVL